MTADDALAVLRSAPAFDRLPADALQRLAASITEAKAVPGQAIVREGDAGDRMFFVASGSVQVLGRSFDGSDIVLARLEPGAYFGEQQAHFDTLQRFGRYPYRNAALGRNSTPAELAYLASRR